jgi:hypothetical protein
LATGANTNTAAYLAANISTNIGTTGTVYAGNVIVNGQPTTYGVVTPVIVANTSPNLNSFSNGTSASPAATVFTLSIPSAGTWQLEAWVRTYSTTGTPLISGGFYTSGTLVANSETLIWPSPVTTANGAGYLSAVVTTTGAATYTVGVWSSGTGIGLYSDATGRTKATATLLSPSIAVQATATGTVNSQYINVTNSNNQNIAASGTDIIWDTNSTSSGIPYNVSTGVFTLTAGVTYNIVGMLSFQQYSANGFLLYQFVDATTNATIGSQTVTAPYNTGYNEVNNGSLDIVYTPNTNQTVKFRITGGTSGLTAQHRGGYFSRAAITQINQAFALNSIKDLTVGTANTAGNLNVYGTITYNGAPVTTGTVSKNYAKYTRTASQSVSANSVIVCNVPESTSGTAVSVNTGTGQVTLTAGTYRLRGTAGTIAGGAAASLIGYGWYNETTSAWIGEGAQIISPASTNYNISTGGTAEAVITVASSTVVTLRVISATNVSSIGGNQSDFAGTYANPWIDIEQMGATFALNALATMSTTGDVSVGGNLNVTGTSTSLVTKASGIVNAGVDVVLGNLKARIPTSGNRSLQLSTVSGTYTVSGSEVYYSNGVGGATIDGAAPLSVTTTPAYLRAANNLVALVKLTLGRLRTLVLAWPGE